MSKIGQWLKTKKNLIFAAAGIAALTAGMSLALFTDSESAANTAKTGKVAIQVDEILDSDSLKKTDISVTGVGESPCYVRMRVDVPVLRYSSEGGEERIFTPTVSYNQRKVGDGDGDLTSVQGDEWNSFGPGTENNKIRPGSKSDPADIKSAEWVKKPDGYWYLSVPLEEGEKAVLCNSVEYEGLGGADSGELGLPSGISKDQLEITVYAEAVQSEHIVEDDTLEGAEAAYKAFQKLKEE